MRFFNTFILLATTLLLPAGCGVESPVESGAEDISFEKLALPSYEYINAEVPLYRMMLEAQSKNVPVEAFAWEIILQHLNLSKFKLSAYKDAKFSVPAFGTNPIAVSDRKIPDSQPDSYFQTTPIFLIYMSVSSTGRKQFDLPVKTPIYFEFSGLMEVAGSQPGLAVYLEGAYLAEAPAAKKPIVFEKK